MPASIADRGQSAAGWESPNPERLQESPAVAAVGSQARCLQNESMGFVQCYQFESTVCKEVQGKHSVPLVHDNIPPQLSTNHLSSRQITFPFSLKIKLVVVIHKIVQADSVLFYLKWLFP